ncbi:protein kinase domain-containing protein [Mariniblastus fucicola]|uniref:Serine/threonine-protein kinase StkP n=1 Tax=Mariniblastus fucicola TaxID=980251 RepID=A0A5B9PBQ1_9BACT|nr:protein kinase [Mariniblastus fucicola]QEG23694.1 Serine/threonine-protein kinase StkP [Mariniblastus fucicola]
MSVVDREHFLQCVAKCGVLGKEALDKWLDSIDPDVGSKDLARDLIRKKLATNWQAKMLAKGANRLTLGNYLLTERMTKAEFGDRFAAVHRQLSRAVSIQYLPASVCGTPEARKKVFAFGSKLAEIDHPNLVHVYDIDEERNRIYLVSEAPGGALLEDFLRDQAPLKFDSVAAILAGCLRGLKFAHKKGVVHGGLSGKTVVIKPNGEPQIRGLTQFAVQNALAENPAVANDDLTTLKAIAATMMVAVDDADRESAGYVSLQSAIGDIVTDSEASLSKFEQIVRETAAQRVTNGLNLASSNADSLEAKGSLDGNSDAGPSADVGLPPTKLSGSGVSSKPVSNKPVPSDAGSDGFLTSIARRNPVALICASSFIALLLIGGTVLAASRLVASPTGVAVADVPADDSKAKKVSASVSDSRPEASSAGSRKSESSRSNSKPASNLKSNSPSQSDSPDFRDRKGPLSGSGGLATDATFNKPATETKAVPIEVVQNVGTEPSILADQKSEPESEGTSTTSKAFTIENKKTSVDVEQVLQPGADPFESFPKTVDLPEIASAEQVSLGKLVLEKKHLLGAELLLSPMAHKSQPMFVLNRSTDDRQTWEIGYKKKKRSEPVVFAKLQKTPNELRFNWLPAAAEVEPANFIRNCLVKLSTAKHSHWLALRKPVRIEGFRFGKKVGSVKLEFEIPHMPNPVAISATLGPMDFDRLDSKNYRQKALLDPAVITPNAPARMYFHEDADRFLSLDVIADIRKQLILQAALVIQASPAQPGIVLEDPTAFPQLAAQIRQRAKQEQEKSRLAQASNLKSDEKRAYRSAATKATDQAELTPYYEHVVPQLLEKDIPVTLMYALDDQHRIVLATTVEIEETEKE